MSCNSTTGVVFRVYLPYSSPNVTACGLCFEPQFGKRCIINIDLLFKHLRDRYSRCFRLILHHTHSDSLLSRPCQRSSFFPLSVILASVCIITARFSEINMKYGKHDENRKNVQNFSTIN